MFSKAGMGVWGYKMGVKITSEQDRFLRCLIFFLIASKWSKFSTFILDIEIYGLLIIYSVFLKINFVFAQKQIENILQIVVCRKEKKLQNAFLSRTETKREYILHTLKCCPTYRKKEAPKCSWKFHTLENR